jgi:hypothetical protein
MVPQNIRAVQEAVARFNDRDAREGYFDLYDPHCRIHGLPPGLPPNLAGLQTFYRVVWEAFPDIAITLEEVFGENDSLAVRFEARGVHTSDFFGMPASGRLTTFFVLCMLRFANRRVVERWAQMSFVG